LTNFIQLDVASSGPPVRSTLPFQTAGPGTDNFASTLQNAAKTGSPALARPLPAQTLDGATAVAGQGKRAEKKMVNIAKTTAPPSQTLAPAATDALKVAIPIVITRLQPIPVPMPSPVVAESFAIRDSIPPSTVSTRSDSSAGLVSEANSTKLDVSSALMGKFQNSASSVPALGSGKLMPASDPPSPPNADAAVKQVIPLPSGDVRPPLTTPNESLATQHGVAEPNIAKKFSGTEPSDPAALDAPAQSPPPSIAQSAEVSRDGDPSLAPTTLTQSAMPQPAVVPTNETPNVVLAANQSAADNKPQTVNSDFPPPAINPNGIPQQVMDSARDAAINVAGQNQPVADDKSQSANGPGLNLDAAVSSFSLAISSMPSSAEISKPISIHAGMAVKAAKTAPAADARPKETPVSSAPSSPETRSSKPSDSPANPADANAQPQPPVAAPAAFAVRMMDGDQPGTAATTNVLAQVPPPANQAAESPVAASPAADSASPAASGPPVQPASTVEVARLVTGVAQSEMHIGLRTQAFGNVEVHTVVRDSQVGVSVGSERGDLRSLFAPEVSGLQNTFRQQDLRFDSIRFLENSAGTTAGFSGGSNSQARSSNQQHSSPAGLFSIHGPPEDSVELDVGAEIRAKLNVHA